MKQLVLLSLFFPVLGWAEIGRVVQIDRAVADAPNRVPPRLFYVDIGIKQGVGVGDILQVYRDRTVVSGITGQVGDIFATNVGELRVKFVADTTSIAELTEQRNPDSVPQLDYATVMIGDKVRVKPLN